ncbi:hypothetical protein [Paenibacillus herberti]|uniref:Uncharacterized protein n=1 Tax=Paenibacillus herberti TaxID=1619309 RepID=A0A229NUW0_9BACL|nr:hypothetical protein [Paenibacillus herberti]OXM13658.1 hypothetical protein CGZ75_21810 [Paenibacillus herberti]
MGSKSSSGIILILFILLVIVTGIVSNIVSKFPRQSDVIEAQGDVTGTTQGFDIINNTRNHSFFLRDTYGERVSPTPSFIIPPNGGITHFELPTRAFTTTRVAALYDVYNDFGIIVGYLQFTLESFSGITAEILGPETTAPIKTRKDNTKRYPTLFLTDPM